MQGKFTGLFTRLFSQRSLLHLHLMPLSFSFLHFPSLDQIKLCYRKEGTNHYQNCRELTQKYRTMIKVRGFV